MLITAATEGSNWFFFKSIVDVDINGVRPLTDTILSVYLILAYMLL